MRLDEAEDKSPQWERRGRMGLIFTRQALKQFATHIDILRDSALKIGAENSNSLFIVIGMPVTTTFPRLVHDILYLVD